MALGSRIAQASRYLSQQGSGSPLRSLLSSESAEPVQRGEEGGREESKAERELSLHHLVLSTPSPERALRSDKVKQELLGVPGPLGSAGPKTELNLGVLQTQPLRIPPSGKLRGYDGAGCISMMLLLISQAARKLTATPGTVGYSCPESLASHWDPKSRTSQTESSKIDSNGSFQLGKPCCVTLGHGIQLILACSTAKVERWLGGA